MLKKGANVRAWRKFGILTDCFAVPRTARMESSSPEASTQHPEAAAPAKRFPHRFLENWHLCDMGAVPL
jgi:hypothetical protein